MATTRCGQEGTLVISPALCLHLDCSFLSACLTVVLPEVLQGSAEIRIPWEHEEAELTVHGAVGKGDDRLWEELDPSHRGYVTLEDLAKANV